MRFVDRRRQRHRRGDRPRARGRRRTCDAGRAPVAAAGRTRREIGPRSEPRASTDIDVTDAAGRRARLSRARAAFGPVDILVNNAGAGADGAVREDFARDVDARFGARSDLGVSDDAVDAARSEGERLGRADHQRRLDGGPDRLRLCLGLLRRQARRHRPDARARARTGQHRRHRQRRLPRLYRHADAPARRGGLRRKTGRDEDETLALLAKSNPQGRLVTPEEVADTVRWLASPGAASINGQAIVVAGGEVMAG